MCVVHTVFLHSVAQEATQTCRNHLITYDQVLLTVAFYWEHYWHRLCEFLFCNVRRVNYTAVTTTTATTTLILKTVLLQMHYCSKITSIIVMLQCNFCVLKLLCCMYNLYWKTHRDLLKIVRCLLPVITYRVPGTWQLLF